MPRAKAAAAAPAKKARAPKNSHQLAAPLPEGEVLRDSFKKDWKVGKPIGSGGFGLLYLAAPDAPGKVGSDAGFVMKLEPHSNGPLFCELHFYQRAAKPDSIKTWMASKKLKSLGMPKYIASGTHDRAGSKYRFMIMERFGTDLQKLFEENQKHFPEKAVYMMAMKVLNVLEYIHSKEYTHGDIKASNLLLGYGPGKTDEVYLVDYGLAYRYISDGKVKDYKEDPKRCHDGTIEFTSRDAHMGVTPGRRGDLEILGYCLLQWLCGKLPWEDNLNNKDYVKNQKIKYMSDLSSLFTKCFPSKTQPEELKKFFQYVVDLPYLAEPDYDKCRQIFKQALKRCGGSESGKLDFGTAQMNGAVKSPTKGHKRKSQETDSDSSPLKRKRKPATPRPADAAKAKGTPKVKTTPRARATPKKSALSPAPPSASKVIYPVAVGPPLPPVDRSRKKPTVAASKLKKRSRKAEVASSSTQTSPGLKGLRRSRKK